jgi:predicted DCC family thiol-disulfide oxidoreductase YuxK
LFFSPLQGKTAKETLPPHIIEDLNTLVLFKEGQTHTRSTAVLLALNELGGLWAISQVILYLPKRIRDAIYDWVALRRYKWFGRHEECLVPTSSEKNRFLP